MKNEAQSEAPSVARLLDWIYDDENGVSHCCGQRGTGEGSRPELKAKINRLIAGAEENGILKGLYQARYATEPGSEEEQRIDNQIAELSNNLSKGDGDEANGA